MGYKFNSESKTWEVWYARRHPETGKAITLKRKNLPSENAAKKVEKRLIEAVSEKIHEQIFPTWKAMVMEYIDHCRNRGLTEKTVTNVLCCLSKSTFGPWGSRIIDRISTQDIRDLVMCELEGRSELHKRALLKFSRGVFNVAVEQNILQRMTAIV